MADYSRRPRRGFVKQFSSVFGLGVGRKGVYDDVLKTRAPSSSFTPPVLVRDYAEIFNRSQPSSIPVLELDQFDRSDYESKFDYSNVFGGTDDGPIGRTYAEVFCVAADGVRRRIDDSLSHSTGSDHSAALEESQKQTHESLFGRKHNMSYDKITREGKAETDEITGRDQKLDVSVSISATDGTVPLESAEANTSGAGKKTLKQNSDEAPVRKHSRKISSGGHSEQEHDDFIEVDVRSRNEYGSDKTVSSGIPMEADIIISEELAFEVASPSDFVLHLSSPNAILKEQASYKSNASEDPCDVSISSSGGAVKSQSLDNPFIRDSALDGIASGQNLLTQDHDKASGTPEILMGNLNVCSCNASEKAEDGSHNSQQDVKHQTVNGLTMPSISNHVINASVAVPQKSSELTPQTRSQPDFSKLNTASEVDIVSKIIVSRNFLCDVEDRASDGHLTSNVDHQSKVLDEMTSVDMPGEAKVIKLKSQCNLGNAGSPVKNSTILSGGFTQSTYSKATYDHFSSSSDDEIEKKSEAAMYVSAVKRAIREAQVWINIAKESDGVKGFMKPFVAKTFGQVKVVKEVHNSEVKETPEFFELGQTTIKNNCSTSAARNDYVDAWSTSSQIKVAPTNNAGEAITFKGTVFCVSGMQQQKEDAAVSSSSKEKIEISSTTQYATPYLNTSDEKLTLYNNEEDLKSLPKEDVATMQGVDDSQLVRIVEEADCCKVPKVGKTEMLVISTDNLEAIFNDYDDTNTMTGINEAENESHETMHVRDQGFMMCSFHDNFEPCQAGFSEISIEIEDLVSGTGEMVVHPKQNEVIKADSECVGTPRSDKSENDLTSLEEENVNTLELDPHDQVSDCEDFQDYASAGENLVSTDTDDEIIEKDLNLPAQDQIREIEDKVMQHMVATEVITIPEDVFAPCFRNLNEEPTIEESHESEAMPLLNNVIHETEGTPKELVELILVNLTEEPVVAKAGEREDKQFQNTATHNVASEARTETLITNLNNDAVDKETDVIVDMPMLNMVTHDTKNTSEDGITPCVNCVDEDPGVEDTEGVEAIAGRNMVIADENNISESDIALSFDNSKVDLMVVEIEAGTARESIVSSLSQILEKGVMGDATSYIPEHTKLEVEGFESAPSVEFASKVDYAYSHSDGSGVEQISTDSVTEEFIANTVEESRSTPWICDPEKKDSDAACFFDLEDSEELHDVAITEKGCETLAFESFINNQGSIDAAVQGDANKLESTPLCPEHDNHELEAGIQFFEPLPDCITNEETTEFEQHGGNLISEIVHSVLESGNQICEPPPDTIKIEEPSEFEQQDGNLIQPAERHERKKWEIPKESFALPELKVGIFDILDTMEQDSCEVKRQMDKHERKKWEIPMRTFELPALDDGGIVEKNEDNAGQDRANATKSADKLERRKWKTPKEAHDAPLCAEADEQTLGQDGFVVITAPEEEMRIADHSPTNIMHFEESSQHYGLQNEILVKEELVVPDKGVSSRLCVDKSQEHMRKQSLLEMKILDEEVQEKQLNETSDQLEAKVEEGKSDERGEFAKVLEDVNVKDEIKKTLGMLWKKIYKSKHNEDFESVELKAQEEENFKRVADKDLNLEGPVELVESPRRRDDIEVFNSSGQSSGSNEDTEETSYSKRFEINRSKHCSSEELISTTGLTGEAQGKTSSASDSCKLQEDRSKSWAEETGKQNNKNNENDLGSHSEDIRSSNWSENLIEMARIHGAEESQQGEIPKTTIFPSDTNECGRTDCEMVSRFEVLLSDDRFVSDAENARNTKLVLQDNGSKECETVKTTSADEAIQEKDSENYFEDEMEACFADEFSDRSSTNSEQQHMTSGRQDSNSVPDSKVSNDMSSHEPKLDEIDQSIPHMSSCKGVLREEEESMDEVNKQEEAPEVSLLHKEKAKIKNVAGENNTSQLTVKENLNDDEPSKAEERAKETLYKEVIPNQEVLQNILRAKERERILVDRAIREARERAFAEAREQAAMERAKAKAHQKSTVNNQERLPEALPETKLAAEEDSIEAKRNAELERAAVEKVTAEARQRALEKAMSQKEQTSQDRSSRFPDASSYQYGSISLDGVNDDNSSESAVRFKAINEKEQRIAERAAKALEDKNMRDLLVQREQAERNRLADALDTDVKRWANGKKGNLRALLSTLQYVLGPDCGWQPIHLTDIVTTDAVKKAYRKATLFVHPDKLQQRGATIKQKYICEKVFELLKEAWNRFDRVEVHPQR